MLNLIALLVTVVRLLLHLPVRRMLFALDCDNCVEFFVFIQPCSLKQRSSCRRSFVVRNETNRHCWVRRAIGWLASIGGATCIVLLTWELRNALQFVYFSCCCWRWFCSICDIGCSYHRGYFSSCSWRIEHLHQCRPFQFNMVIL